MTEYDADLRGLGGYNIQQAHSAVMVAVNRTLVPHSLRWVSYSVLSVIVTNPGLRQADIADTLAIERPNLVQVIGALEEAGWIMRRRVECNCRDYELRPTEAGCAALAAFDATLTTRLGETLQTALIAGLRAVEAAGPRAEIDAQGEPGHALSDP